jgi:hypothetical protein
VLLRSGAVLLRVLPVYLLVLVLIGIPELYVYAWSEERQPADYDVLISEGYWQSFLSKLAIDTFIVAIFDALAGSWLLAAALSALSGESAPFRVILVRGLRAWPRLAPMFAFTALVWSVAVWSTDLVSALVGLLAGMIVLIAFWVYGPVIVAERCGLWTGIRRALFLVSGNAWRIAVLVLIFAVIIGTALFAAQHFLPNGLSADLTWEVDGPISAGDCLIQVIEGVLTVATAVCYVLLRNDKDGVPAEEIALVFD